MKSIILFLFLVFCSLNGTSQTNAQIGNFELEFSTEKLSWYDLKRLCAQKGKGWFIPSTEQLLIIESRFTLPKDKMYWSSKEGWSGNGTVKVGQTWDGSQNDVAEILDMTTGKIDNLYKSTLADYVIARSLGNNFTQVKNNLNQTMTVGQIKVSRYELKNVTYSEATSLCAQLGDGWRLPTLEEMKLISTAGINVETDLSLKYYFTSTRPCDNCFDQSVTFNPENLKTLNFGKESGMRVIPVYSENQKQAIQTWNFGQYEITKDFFGPMTYTEAESFCLSQSTNSYNPWRVTTMAELSSMKVYKNDIPGMIGKRFMSYENKTSYFERNNMSTVKIEPNGVAETWMGGSETSKFYFFMSRRKSN